MLLVKFSAIRGVVFHTALWYKHAADISSCHKNINEECICTVHPSGINFLILWVVVRGL